MLDQKSLRLSPRPVAGETAADFNFRRGELNLHLKGRPSGHVPPEKLLADLLKRQARRAMADVTQCQPATLPAHIARLESLAELIQFHLRNDLSGAEALMSGRQLAYPVPATVLLRRRAICGDGHKENPDFFPRLDGGRKNRKQQFCKRQPRQYSSDDTIHAGFTHVRGEQLLRATIRRHGWLLRSSGSKYFERGRRNQFVGNSVALVLSTAGNLRLFRRRRIENRSANIPGERRLRHHASRTELQLEFSNPFPKCSNSKILI